jgi:hypothetical protein
MICLTPRGEGEGFGDISHWVWDGLHPNPPFSPNDSPMEKSSDTSTHNCSVPVRQSAR